MSEFIENNVVTYYIDGDGGNDSNAGTSVGAAWATIGKMVTVLNAGGSSAYDGDLFIIMNTAEYELPAGLVVTWANQDFLITGANSAGVVDGTKAVITGSGLNSSTAMVSYESGGADGGVWANIHFDAKNTSAHCIETPASGANAHGVHFVNCRFSNATDDGINQNNVSGYWNYVNCRFDNNGQCGLQQTSGSQFNVMYKCIFDNNGDNGLDCGGYSRCVECVFHNNEDRGAHPNHGGAIFLNCIFDSNSEDGAYVSGSGSSVWVNNIFSNNTQHGFQIGNNTEATHFNSLFYNNTSGDMSDQTSSAHAKYFNYTPGASGFNPNFVSGTGPNFDFTTAATGASAGIFYNSGLEMPYMIHGTTSDNPGLYKFVNTETISVF